MEVTFRDDALEIRRGSREWRIPLSQLPVRADDCDDPREQESCKAQPAQSPCVACIHDAEAIAVDEAHECLYLAVATGVAKNRPWVIFRYSLVNSQITRVIGDYGAGFGMATPSPSGDYLAYVGYASFGLCGTQASIKVIDLRSRQSASVSYPTKSADEIVLIQSLRWAAATVLEYTAEIHSERECRNAPTGNYSKRTVTGRVEVLKLGLR